MALTRPDDFFDQVVEASTMKESTSNSSRIDFLRGFTTPKPSPQPSYLPHPAMVEVFNTTTSTTGVSGCPIFPRSAATSLQNDGSAGISIYGSLDEMLFGEGTTAAETQLNVSMMATSSILEDHHPKAQGTLEHSSEPYAAVKNSNLCPSERSLVIWRCPLGVIRESLHRAEASGHGYLEPQPLFSNTANDLMLGFQAGLSASNDNSFSDTFEERDRVHKDYRVSVNQDSRFSKQFTYPTFINDGKKPSLGLEELIILAIVQSESRSLGYESIVAYILNNCLYYYRKQLHPNFRDRIAMILQWYDFPTRLVYDAGTGNFRFALAPGQEWFILNNMDKDSRQSFRLTELPLELRLMIYIWTLRHPLEDKYAWRIEARYPSEHSSLRSHPLAAQMCLTTTVDVNWMLHTRPLHKILAITMACKQLHQEALPLFYQTNHFYFKCPMQLGRALNAIPTRLKFIRHVILKYNPPPSGHECKRSFALLLETKVRTLHLIIDEKKVFQKHGLPKTVALLPGMKILGSLRGLDRVSFAGDYSLTKAFFQDCNILGPKRKDSLDKDELIDTNLAKIRESVAKSLRKGVKLSIKNMERAKKQRELTEERAAKKKQAQIRAQKKQAQQEEQEKESAEKQVQRGEERQARQEAIQRLKEEKSEKRQAAKKARERVAAEKRRAKENADLLRIKSFTKATKTAKSKAKAVPEPETEFSSEESADDVEGDHAPEFVPSSKQRGRSAQRLLGNIEARAFDRPAAIMIKGSYTQDDISFSDEDQAKGENESVSGAYSMLMASQTTKHQAVASPSYRGTKRIRDPDTEEEDNSDDEVDSGTEQARMRAHIAAAFAAKKMSKPRPSQAKKRKAMEKQAPKKNMETPEKKRMTKAIPPADEPE